MPIPLLQRYHDGERTRVWAELLAQGEAIRAQPLYDEAEGVVREIMQRARHNVELLVERLKALEYRFVYPTLVWTPPDKQSIAKLRSFEKRYGPLPLSLRLWHEIVGPVNFMGAHPRLSSYDGRDWDGSERLGAYADPLVIDPLPSRPYPYYLDYARDEKEKIKGPPFAVNLAPDAVHKANHSGGGPTMIMLPNAAADAPLISDDWDGVPFVAYLRTCFQWGGFPGLRQSSPRGRYDPEQTKAERDFLTRDLLPL